MNRENGKNFKKSRGGGGSGSGSASLNQKSRRKNVAAQKKEQPEEKPDTSFSKGKGIAQIEKFSSGLKPRLSIMAKILKHLKERHLNREHTPLTLDEILEETRQLPIIDTTRKWLAEEGLPTNPKIEVTRSSGVEKFKFKPTFKLKDGKSLMRLLKEYDLKGLGGIMGEDLMESLPDCEKYLAKHSKEIIVHQRPTDKKKVYFYRDRSVDMGVDEQFKNLWRLASLDGMEKDDSDQEEKKTGTRAGLVRNKRKLKRGDKIRDNNHVSDILEEYHEF